MKIIITIIVLMLLLTSCYKREDYSNDVCVNDCTIVSGTVITSDKQPLKGATFRLGYEESRYLSVSDNRDFGKAITDDSGHFQFKFYMPKDLLGKANAGDFVVHLEEDMMDYNKYIYSASAINVHFGVFNKRDTNIHFSFYIPEKAFIKLYLENFHPVMAGDKMEAMGYSPYGLMVNDSGYTNPLNKYLPLVPIYLSDSLQSNKFTDSFVMAKDAMNRIEISKTKNGTETIESDTFFVPASNNIELHYSY